MTQNFTHLQACIRRLESFPSRISVPCPVLDYGFSWMRSSCVWEESFPSQRSACKNAEKTFLPIYRQAEEWLRHETDPDHPDSWFSTFRRMLNQHLGELRDVLMPMRTRQTAPVLNRITPLLQPDQVLTELAANLSLHHPPYTLNDPSCYLNYTEYSTYDASEGESGITWLLGKLLIRHGYDLLPALHTLESDLSQKMELCRQAYTVQAEHALQQHIVAPTQILLPMLYQILSTEET